MPISVQQLLLAHFAIFFTSYVISMSIPNAYYGIFKRRCRKAGFFGSFYLQNIQGQGAILHGILWVILMCVTVWLCISAFINFYRYNYFLLIPGIIITLFICGNKFINEIRYHSSFLKSGKKR